MNQVDSFFGAATWIGLQLLILFLPALIVLWVALRGVRALERAARAQEVTAQHLANMTVLLEQSESARARSQI